MVDGGLSGAYITPASSRRRRRGIGRRGARPGSFQASIASLGLGAQLVGVDRCRPRRGRRRRRRSRRAHPRVATSAWNWMPQAASPDPERLQADVAASRARRRRAAARTRRRATGTPRSAAPSGASTGRRRRSVERHLVPADLRLRRRGATLGARGLGEQLRAEAHAQQRRARVERARNSARSVSSQGWRSSWSACIAPPKARIADKPSSAGASALLGRAAR